MLVNFNTLPKMWVLADITNILFAVTFISSSLLDAEHPHFNVTRERTLVSRPRSLSINAAPNGLHNRIMPRMHQYGCTCPHLPTCTSGANIQNVDLIYLALGGIVGYLLSNTAALLTLINTPAAIGRYAKEEKSIPRAMKRDDYHTQFLWLNTAEQQIAPAALLLLDSFANVANNPSCAGRLFCEAHSSFNRHQTLESGFGVIGSVIANIFTLDPITAVESTVPVIFSSATNCTDFSPHCAPKP